MLKSAKLFQEIFSFKDSETISIEDEEIENIQNRNSLCETKPIDTYDFYYKLNKDAVRNLQSKRSKLHMKLDQITPIIDVWQIRPPDFRAKEFTPKPLNSYQYGKLKREQIRQSSIKQPKRVKPQSAPLTYSKSLSNSESLQQNDSKKEFFTRFRKQDKQEELIVIKKAKNKEREPFADKKEHDFRSLISPYDLGLPEFNTIKSADPFAIKFKTEALKMQLKKDNKLKNIEFRDMEPGLQMGERAKTPAPKFQRSLLLPKSAYPIRDQAYTVHLSVYKNF